MNNKTSYVSFKWTNLKIKAGWSKRIEKYIRKIQNIWKLVWLNITVDLNTHRENVLVRFKTTLQMTSKGIRDNNPLRGENLVFTWTIEIPGTRCYLFSCFYPSSWQLSTFMALKGVSFNMQMVKMKSAVIWRPLWQPMEIQLRSWAYLSRSVWS